MWPGYDQFNNFYCVDKQPAVESAERSPPRKRTKFMISYIPWQGMYTQILVITIGILISAWKNIIVHKVVLYFGQFTSHIHF